jgi:hypothetical protein
MQRLFLVYRRGTVDGLANYPMGIYLDAIYSNDWVAAAASIVRPDETFVAFVLNQPV